MSNGCFKHLKIEFLFEHGKAINESKTFFFQRELDRDIYHNNFFFIPSRREACGNKIT